MKAIHNSKVEVSGFKLVGNYKLKYNFESNSQQSERKPKNYLTNKALAKLVSERNGFVYENVKEVLDDLSDIIYEQIISGNRVYLPKIGSIHLGIKPPYKTNINLKGLGGELKEHFVEPRFDLRFFRNEETSFFLKQREVTEEELDRIYYDDLTKTKTSMLYLYGILPSVTYNFSF